MQSELQYVRRETIGRVGILSLDHPKKLNALSETLVRELIDGMRGCVAEGLRVVVLRALPGIKVWSAGHDVSELPEGRRDPLGWADPLRELVRTIETLHIPVIAMVEGSVWGGAMETVMACDIIIAEDHASFAVTPARLGVPYNISGMMTFLNAAPLHVVKEMIYTARPVGAERAERLGMINHVVPVDTLERFTLEMAECIADNAPLSIGVMKEALRVLAGAKPVSPRGFEKVQGLRRSVYDSDDYAEGIRAFKEKRKPAFKGK